MILKMTDFAKSYFAKNSSSQDPTLPSQFLEPNEIWNETGHSNRFFD